MERIKKRQRRRQDSDDDMESDDDNIIIDEANQNMRKDEDIDMNGMIFSDFVFSGLRDNYFHNIKTLIKPLFEFDPVNVSEVADLILLNKEDVGTVIKNEDEDETKNPNVDVFGIFTMVPITYYLNQGKVPAKQIFDTLESKIKKYEKNEIIRTNALHILKNYKIGFLFNERVINLPQEATPITLNLILNEISECKDYEDYDGKFELDYIVTMSKFVKRISPNMKSVKKAKIDQTGEDEILHYKFETEHFIQKSEINITFKIPYEEMNMEYLENKNEPQYYSIIIMKTQNFAEVVKSINNN